VEHDLQLPELAKGIGGFSIYALLKPGARFGLKGSIDGIQEPDMSMGWRMLSMCVPKPPFGSEDAYFPNKATAALFGRLLFPLLCCLPKVHSLVEVHRTRPRQ
jgi:hypothetical protein